MTEKVNFPSGYKMSAKSTYRYAKLTRANIATKMDTSTKEANMMGNNYAMNGSDKLRRKVNVMKLSESMGVDNRLDKGKSTCIKNQNKMIIQNVMANRDGMFKDKLAQTHSGYGINMDLVAKAIKVIMNAKLDIKLGELMKICLQLRGMVEKSLTKMREDQVDVYKVTTKIEDFDETMPIVQVRVGKFEVRDVLMDGGSGVNIIFESLRKKLRLRRLQLAPFVVQMVDQ